MNNYPDSGDAEAISSAPPRRLLKEQETAKYLGMSVAFLRKSRMSGSRAGHTPGPPWVRLGRSVRYDLADLDQWIADNRRVPKSGVE